MEISPIRQLKNLTIEARHTLSLQESKKKRLQFEKSLFLPNNKKRKDVLNFFNKKYCLLDKTKETSNNISTSKELNKQPAQNTFSNVSDISSESSEKSERSFPMKRSNKEFAASEEGDSSKKSNEKLSFPSYVAYRTKGNKLMFIQNKTDQKFPTQTATREQEHRGLLESATFGTGNKEPPSVTVKRELTTQSNENPSITNLDLTNLRAHASTSIQNSTVPPNTVIDLTKKSQSFERPTVLTQSIRSESEVIISDSPQPASMSATNVSPCLLSTSSNSMEFLIQSTVASNESTTFSSDYLEISNAETPNNNTQINQCTPNLKPINRSAEGDGTAALMKATSPVPLSVIVSNENLAMQFSPNPIPLIQDAQVQSSTSVNTLQPNEQLVQNPDEVTVSTSNTEHIPDLPAISNSSEASNEQAVNQPSSNKPVPNLLSKVQDIPKRRYFDAVSLQRQVIADESTASTSSIGSQNAEQQPMQAIQNERQDRQVETLNTHSNMHGQISENLTVHKAPQVVPNFEFISLNNNSSTSQQVAPSQQPTTQPMANNEELNPLSRMQNMPNSSRYFTPFYLQRSLVPGTRTTPSTSILNKSSAEQQQSLHAVTNESHPRDLRSSNARLSSSTTETPNISTQSHPRELRSYNARPSSSTTETPNISTQSHPRDLLSSRGIPSSGVRETVSNRFNQTKTAMEAHGQNLQYSNLQACNNNQNRTTQQTFSQSPPHASEQNNHMQHPNQPGNNTLKTNQGTPVEILQPPNVFFARSTAPVVNHNPNYGPYYPPPVPGCPTIRPYFPPFPAIQQQNIHSNNVPNTSNFKNTTSSQPQIANPNFYGYPPRNEASNHLGNPNNGQPYFPGLQGLQNSSANQTTIRTDYNQISYDSRNFQPAYISNNNIMRHQPNNPNSFWGQNTPAAVPPNPYQPSLEQNSVDPNQWLNDRFQQTLKPHDNNDRSTWLARPQAPIGPISTGPVEIDAWVRARMQQAIKPPTVTSEQRLSQIEIKINSYDKFFDNLQGINRWLESTAMAAAPPAPPPAPAPAPMPASGPAPWQTNSQPIIGNIATQPVPDTRIAWGEYYNQMSTIQMEGNRGYPRTNAASQNFMRMDGNPSVNPYPVPPQQPISHQINAADSTTGGNSNNSSLDLRSFRPTPHYHPSYPHMQPNPPPYPYTQPQPPTQTETHPQTHPNNTSESFKNQYIFF